MAEIRLRYGCNPHQGSARLLFEGAEPPPLQVLNGEPSYINMLDAVTSWQLVRELAKTTGKPAAASYKHVSPAGAAVAGPVSTAFVRSQMLDSAPKDPLALAYMRARGGDRVSSFGDAVAVSGTVGIELAELLRREVSDLIVAPGYEPEALALLRSKRRGQYLILEMNPEYQPPRVERRDAFGFTLEQERNLQQVGPHLFEGGGLTESVTETLVVATTALKYAQSNSVCVAWDGQIIGLAAGQQSRIQCTRLACDKAERWMLQTHPKVLQLDLPSGLGRTERFNLMQQFILWNELSEAERAELRQLLPLKPEPISHAEREEWFQEFPDLCLSSDAFIPFRDNVDRAAGTNIKYIAHTGGAIREDVIRAAGTEHGIVVLETGVRCFFH